MGLFDDLPPAQEALRRDAEADEPAAKRARVEEEAPAAEAPACACPCSRAERAACRH